MTGNQQSSDSTRKLTEQLNSIVQQTPAPTLVLRGDDYRIDQINPPMLAFMGRKEDVIGQPLLAIMPELAGQYAWQQVQRVYQAGVDFDQSEVMVPHVRGGVFQDHYYNVSYRPLREATRIVGMIQVAIDVTEQVLARQKLEESELFARTLFEHSPIAKAVFVGQDMVIRTANQNMLYMWGKDSSVVGQPFMEALPELLPTPQLDRLRQVLKTGERFYQAEEKFELLRYGQAYTGYYEYTYEALRSASGAIYGVICVATEVTQQVLARQKLEVSEARFRSLIKEAPVAMLVYEGPDMVMVEANEQMLTIFGRGDAVLGKPLLKSVPELANTALPDQYRQVLATGQTHYQYEERILLVKDKGPYWGYYDYTYKALYDKDGTAYGVICTAVDVSSQVLARQVIEDSAAQYRQLSEQLDELVQQRTHELAVTNQELIASNKEYVAINEQLKETNSLLIRSNDNLQTFAYVASHDLQEPLRKIQQFGDLLKTHFADSAGGEELVYLERMQLAAKRMSTLIKDLLGFSRIATQRNVDKPVMLNTLVADVLGVLDLAIAEVNAQIQVDSLPTVSGDAVQLGQLFQNLLSNALKFYRPDIPPHIHISNRTIAADELPLSVKPTRQVPLYYCIEVSDNGIGFDEKYIDRIFQVFQRLHGKSQYAGTGVGLAICEKVAANHGGAITASSQRGKGATFYVYLPA